MQLTAAGSWWPFSAARRAGLAPVDPDPNSTHYSGVILTRKEVQQGIPTGTQQIRDSRLPKSEKTLDRESLFRQRSRESHFPPICRILRS